MSVTKPRMGVDSGGFVRVPAAEYRRLKKRAAAEYVDALTYAKNTVLVASIGNDNSKVDKN